MPRAFGIEIIGNRGKNEELSPEARSSIISKWEASILNKNLMAEYGVHWNAISNIIKRWKTHNTLHSLPQESRL